MRCGGVLGCLVVALCLTCLSPASAFSLQSPFNSLLAPCLPAFCATTTNPRAIGLRAAGMSAANPKYNFAPISGKDGNVLGSHRPGFLPNEENEKPGAVDDALVAEWAAFMKSQKVREKKPSCAIFFSSEATHPLGLGAPPLLPSHVEARNQRDCKTSSP
jgi:hypothetical protein